MDRGTLHTTTARCLPAASAGVQQRIGVQVRRQGAASPGSVPGIHTGTWNSAGPPSAGPRSLPSTMLACRRRCAFLVCTGQSTTGVVGGAK